jgi:5-methylcytosine-specific restriction endonuclease McrA
MSEIFSTVFYSTPNFSFRIRAVDHFTVEISETEIKREREKSRELRKSRWWQNRLAMGRCHFCDAVFAPEELTMDHLVPISRGGKASRNNVVTACKECNSQKKYLLPIEWEEYLNQSKSRESLSE